MWIHAQTLLLRLSLILNVLNMSLPPPFCWHKYGNRQIFPKPTEYPIILRKNCILPDQAALSASPYSPPLLDVMEFLCGADNTIVTPCVPSPRARVLSGAISWPFLGPFIPSNFVVMMSGSRFDVGGGDSVQCLPDRLWWICVSVFIWFLLAPCWFFVGSPLKLTNASSKLCVLRRLN